MTCSPDVNVWFDTSRLVRRQVKGIVPTGIDHVALAYLRHVQLYSGAVVHQGPFTGFVPPPASAQHFRAITSGLGSGAAHRARAALAMFSALVVRQRGRQPMAGDILLHVTHSDLDDETYLQQWRARGLQPVIMLHDLIPLTHPGFSRQGEPDRHRRRVRNALQFASGLIFNSQDTRDTVAQHAEQWSLPMPHSVVLPLGTRKLPLPSHPARPNPHRPTFLMVGTIEPRKNHQMVLDLWKQLCGGGARPPRLVIIGRRGWNVQALTAELDRPHPSWAPHVVERGACDDAELSRWMSEATALLMPSAVEGFGMPVAEALQAGLPVIANDLPVFKEVAGPVPDYIPAQDHAAWRQAILDYAREGSERRRRQCERMRSFRAPSWADHFQGLDAFLRGIHHASR